MIDVDERIAAQASALCTSCGLCCNGHLFIWAKLKPSELDAAEALGMHVYRSDPTQRGFRQPCPLWQGKCTIYDSPHYPRACRSYQCKLLKDLLAERVSLSAALEVVEQAKAMIRELQPRLPASTNNNFRARLVAQIEHPDETAWRGDSYREFRAKADALLNFYETKFGVTGFVE